MSKDLGGTTMAEVLYLHSKPMCRRRWVRVYQEDFSGFAKRGRGLAFSRL